MSNACSVHCITVQKYMSLLYFLKFAIDFFYSIIGRPTVIVSPVIVSYNL